MRADEAPTTMRIVVFRAAAATSIAMLGRTPAQDFTVNAAAFALAFCVLIGFAVLFQLALAAGAPWGEAAMGGRFPGRLPAPMRVAAVVQAAILLLLAGIVLVRSELLASPWYPVSTRAIWFVVAFSALAAVLNVATPSKWERRIWAPVTVALLGCSLAVALS